MYSHFNTEDGRKNTYYYYKTYYAYYFKKGSNIAEIQKKVYAVYGEGAVTDRTGQKWVVKFRAGDFSLDDAVWLGRTVEVDSSHIKSLIENNQHYMPCRR